MSLIKEALDFGEKRLKDICDRPRLEAQILLCAVGGLNRIDLFKADEALIDQALYNQLITRREQGEPIEYIIGSASFYSRDFLCESGVLIPRPETELLVDRVIELSKGYSAPKIAEIGVGCGAICVSLAIALPNASIIGSDINEKAIELTRKNAVRFGVLDRIDLIETNMLDRVNDNIDILVSNPPYIAADYPLPKPVSFEPKNALIGGERGSEILEEIIALRKPILACECGYDQESVLSETLAKNGYKMVEFYKDYAGLTRGFTAKR
ncbi:MAG: peptide chain release factor N(5)-glutamine methyltransferase [Helicobacteraceae bacterium]|jgi:release factor glutamine methyltransferase|nr:peptide chain release factor N(5)-glutamine methyltransferase [Helicobacteraceae bacterium]